MIALAKLVNIGRFNQFVKLFTTNKYFFVYSENSEIFTRFNIFLLAVQLLSVSLFLFLLATFFIEDITLDNYIVFIQIFGFYTLFNALKYYIEKIIGTLFSIEKHIDKYLFQKLSYRNLIALIILFFNVILFYAYTPSTFLVVFLVVLILVLNVFLLINSYKANEKLVRGELFYFILYLCALEISPYIIAYKLLT